jgi:AcrR family transcriptional regulator
MAKRSEEEVRSSAIDALIALAERDEASHCLSLKNVAEEAHLSERLLLSIFESQEELLALAGEKVYAALSEKALSLSVTEKDLHSFFNAYLDWLLANPEITYFTLNCGHGVPHIAPLKDDRITHRQKVIADAKEILTRFGIAPEEDYLLLWSYILRHLVYFAGYVLHDPFSDTLDNRRRSEMIIDEGLHAFSKEEEGE